MHIKFYYIAIIFILSKTNVKAQNYIDYHHKIINLECSFFLENKTEKILESYDSLFTKYDFVFLQDCITAAQIAIFKNDEKYFMRFMEKASTNGLLFRHFQYLKYINTSDMFMKNKEKLQMVFSLNKNKYYSRIDTSYLKKFVALYAKDQCEKNGARGHIASQFKKNYMRNLKNTTDTLLGWIEKKGMPCDKIIGINQNDILKELTKKSNYDLLYYFYRDSVDYIIGKGQFEHDEFNFAATMLIPIIWHNKCSYSKIKKYLPKEIENGNIHPRDVACIKDQDFDQKYNPCYTGDSVYCNINRSDYIKITDEQANANRKIMHVAPIQLEDAKLAFGLKYKMRLRFGFVGIR